MSGAIQQQGPLTRGHVLVVYGNGQAQDGGSGSGGDSNVTELGITNTDGTLGLWINSGTIAGEYSQLGFTVGTDGAITISAASFNGAPAAALFIDINGTLYPFPGPGNGDVLGPASSVDGDLIAFNGTTGVVIKDSGVNATTLASFVSGPSAAVSGNLPAFNGTTGKVIEDSGITISPAMGTVVAEPTTNAALNVFNWTSTQSGATARSVGAKLNDFVSVKDFGAVGDGVTDDTTAVQTAINDCVSGNLCLFFPTGTYLCTNLTLPHNTAYDSYPPPLFQNMPRLIGEPGATILKKTSADNTYLIASARWATDVAFVNSPVWIENLVFDANGIADTAAIFMSWGSYYYNNIFRNGVLYGCWEPASTQNLTTLGGGRSTSRYERNQFSKNGTYGFTVDPYTAPAAISDYWFIDNLLFDNGTSNLIVSQSSGWLIKGNHTYWSDVPPTTGSGYGVYIGDGVQPIIRGNYWEGYSTTHFGLALDSGASGPLVSDGDTFFNGLGCEATFGGGVGWLTRVRNGQFYNGTGLQHTFSSAACELVSENNVFENTGPYQFSSGAGHAGLFRSVNDRISTSQYIYEGVQKYNDYSVKTVDGVLYPSAYPYQVIASTQNVIRVTTALAADEVIILPASPVRGLRYRVVRTSTASGAFTLHVQASGGGDVYNLATAGEYADYEYDGSIWCQIGTGTAA